MAMNLLLESLSRCLNGTSTVRGSSGGAAAASAPAAGLGTANDEFDRFEPAEVQVRLRDHDRRSRSAGSRRRSTTPKNRNGRRRSDRMDDAGNDDDDGLLVHAHGEAGDDVDMLADARRDAHRANGNGGSGKEDDQRPSSSHSSQSRRRRRQRSASRLTVEERRNDIFRLPSDHPASRPSSPNTHGSASDPNHADGSSRGGGSPRMHVVTPEPAHPLGLIMCGRTSPAVAFRRGSSAPNTTSSTTTMSNLLRESTGGLRALCFASPVRDSHEVAAEQRSADGANANANASHGIGHSADDRTVDTFSILLNDDNDDGGDDDPTVNTADCTHATQDDTVASTHYFDAKLAHLVETSPPMPLYRQYEVTGTNPDHDIRTIVETNSHRSIKEAGVDLAGGLINVVKKKWSSPERTGGNSRAAPQSRPLSQPLSQPRRESSRGESRRQPQPTASATARASASTAAVAGHSHPPSSSSSSSPTAAARRPKETSSDDPPTPPRHPRGYREEAAVAAAAHRRRGRSTTSGGGGKLGGHPNPSEDSSVPSLEFSRNSSQSTYQSAAPSI